MSEIEILKKQGLNDVEIKKTTDLIDKIDKNIIMDSELNCNFTLDDKIFHLQPLTRKLSRKYTIFIQKVSQKNIDSNSNSLVKYNTFNDLIEDCLNHSILYITNLEGDTIEFDIDDLSDPIFDELILYFNIYFKKYKKK